jgi:hypothetical protein
MKGEELRSFDRELCRLSGEDPELRPFVCEGSPLGCEIFIVGCNPATSVGFWEFWDQEYGFKKSVWLEEYKAIRRSQGRREVSNTRERIQRIAEGAKPVRCLETNIYAFPSPEASSLSEGARTTHVFDFLVRWIRPKVIFVHGKDAMERVEALASIRLDPESPTTAFLENHEVTVLAGSHLSRGWSYARARQLGERLRAICCTGTS